MNSFKMLQTASISGIKVWDAKTKDFNKLNVKSSINLLNPSESEINNALDVAERDLFENVIVYCLTETEFNKLVPMYVTKQ